MIIAKMSTKKSESVIATTLLTERDPSLSQKKVYSQPGKILKTKNRNFFFFLIDKKTEICLAILPVTCWRRNKHPLTQCAGSGRSQRIGRSHNHVRACIFNFLVWFDLPRVHVIWIYIYKGMQIVDLLTKANQPRSLVRKKPKQTSPEALVGQTASLTFSTVFIFLEAHKLD